MLQRRKQELKAMDVKKDAVRGTTGKCRSTRNLGAIAPLGKSLLFEKELMILQYIANVRIEE